MVPCIASLDKQNIFALLMFPMEIIYINQQSNTSFHMKHTLTVPR